jgi:phage terminase large subunit
MQLEVILPKIWQGFFDINKRYRISYGGRGSGKSFTKAIILVILATGDKKRILCIRALQKSLKDSSMQLIKDAIIYLGVENLFTSGEGFIRGVNGSEFIFSGLKFNSESIKSMQGVDVCWIDEADSVTEKQFTDLTPTIRNDSSEIWISFNPQSEDDYLYKRFISKKSNISVVLNVNYTDNPHFPEVLELERQDCLSNYPDLYNHIWLGDTLDVSDACYFSVQIKQLKEQGHITAISYDSRYPVDTYWDIGYSDYTSIWFVQKVGTEIRIIDFEQNNNEHPIYYASILKQKNYNYRTHYLPHDAKHQRFGMTKAISQQLLDAGLKGFINYTNKSRGSSDIQATRMFMSRCFFDEFKTAEGLRMLKNYKRKYCEVTQRYSDTPTHDWASHASDAFKYLAMHNINKNDIELGDNRHSFQNKIEITKNEHRYI